MKVEVDWILNYHAFSYSQVLRILLILCGTDLHQRVSSHDMSTTGVVYDSVDPPTSVALSARSVLAASCRPSFAHLSFASARQHGARRSSPRPRSRRSGQDKKTVLRVEPYMHFGKFTLRPFVDQGSPVYLPMAVSCEKKFFSVRKVLGTLSSENSELCRRPKKGLSMKSSTIQELGEFLTENKKDVLGTMEKLIGLFADEDGEKLLDACRFLNQQNEVSRDLDEATQQVAYLFDFFEGNRDGLESLLRKAAMIGSRLFLGSDQSLGGGGPVHELQGLGQKGGPEKGAVQGRSRVGSPIRRASARSSRLWRAPWRRRRDGKKRARASLKDDDSDDDEESGSGSDDSSSEKPKKKKQKKTSKKNDKKESSSSAEEVQSSTSESQPKKKGKKAQKSKKLASSSNESEEESPKKVKKGKAGKKATASPVASDAEEGHGKKAKKGQKSGKEAAKQDAAKGKESGKEGTKQEAAKQAMSAQEIKEVAFLDWSAGSIEEMYAQVEEVNGATRGDAKGIVPRDVIRVFVDSVPKKVLACYPLVQQAWDNIPEDQAEIPCAIAKSLLVKLLRLAGDAQEFFEQQSGAGAGGSSAP